MKLFWKHKSPKHLVFIAGCPRSGTSWTWGLLSSFKQVEPLLIEDFPTLAKRHSVKQMKTGAGFVTTETGIFHWNLTDREIRQGIAEKARRYPGAVLLEKTPANALQLDRITTLFPKAKIIHVIRDPRAVVNSMLRSTFSSGLRLAHTVSEAIALYRRHAEAAEPYKSYEHLMRIHYESLWRDPFKELGRICRFIGVDASREDLEQVVKANTAKAQTLASNDFRKGKINSYCEELDKRGLLQIEQELADVFDTYGYPFEVKQI
ncbi:MAG: sulfotransferase [Parapedobacter sp.]|nr:MAG: sulfotransferase [Parapedobacter sp.]